MQTRSFRVALIVAALILLGALILVFSGVLRLASPVGVEIPVTPPTATVTLSGVEVSPAATATISVEPSRTVGLSATSTEIGFNRPTSTPLSGTPLPTPTIFDNPTLLLTPFNPPTETATPLPLSGLGADVELSVVQLRRISTAQGVIILAEVSNVTEQALKNVRLIFATANGQRAGNPVDLSLTLPPGESLPGASAALPASDPVIQNWDSLQAHAVGTPPTAQPGEAGYPVSVTVGYPTITRDKTSLHYDVTVANDTGARVAITGQNIAFYGGDGILLLVVNLGTHDQLADGASYALSGTLSLDQAASEGHTLADYTDMIASISAEIAP